MIAKEVRDTAMGRLMAMMCLGGHPQELEAVCRTSDGFYMGQETGDVGYNVFIGKPNTNAQPSTRDLQHEQWEGYTLQQKVEVLGLAEAPPDGSPIDLEEFGRDQWDTRG